MSPNAAARIAVTGFRGVPASWGGVEHQCEQIYSRLAASGYQVTIYGRSNYVPESIRRYKGMVIKRLPALRSKYLEAFFHTFLAVLHAVLIEKPDILHVYSQGPCLFSWIPRLLRPDMRVFFTCVGLDWQRKKWPWWASAVIRLGEIFSALFPHYRITVSRELQQYYYRRYRVVACHIPNGVVRMKRKHIDYIKRFGLSTGDYLLSVGRLVPEKRIEDVISAYLCSSRRVKLVIVGDSAGTDAYVKNLKEIARGCERILFTGYQYGSNLEELYSNALAFVTASELEGLPLTLLEALSYGLPCIASDIAPHREILEHMSGLLFPPGQVKPLAKRMDDLQQMPPEMLLAMGRNAATALDRHFNWDIIAGRIDRLYRQSLRGGARQSCDG